MTGPHHELFEDASLFPVDLGVSARTFLFLRIEESTLDRTAFIDNRIDAPLGQAWPIRADRIVPGDLPSSVTAWLWHTSFCGSSLLARALHVLPHQVALKEPTILRRLGDARDAGQALKDIVEHSARLLSRPWRQDGGVLIKPTHAALNVATELMDALPQSRAVLLHSDLEDFLLSNLKKSPDTQAHIGALAERALRATAFFPRLPTAASHPPDFICAAALQWAAQRECALDVALSAGESRLRTLAAARLFADLSDTAWRTQQWLQLPANRMELEVRVAAIGQRNAKAYKVSYDAEQRAREATTLRQKHSERLFRALRWAEAQVLPAMRTGAFALPFPLD